MYKIKIFCSFAPSENCKEVFESINNASQFDFYGENKKIYITNEDDYTHAIIMNTAMPELNIPKENVIGLAFEPIYLLGLTPEFIDYAQKHIGKYFIGDKFDLPEPFVEHFAYLWHSQLPPSIITNKPNLMSIIVSHKSYAPGHMYRHMLIEEIIKHNLPIDIYGYGSELYSYRYPENTNIKGKFDGNEPFTDYSFSICIENYQTNHYFSEKIISPIVLNCNPIYLGCRNIDTYFDNVIKLTGNVNEDILLLKNILSTPEKYFNPMYNTKHLKVINLIENIEYLYSNDFK